MKAHTEQSSAIAGLSRRRLVCSLSAATLATLPLSLAAACRSGPAAEAPAPVSNAPQALTFMDWSAIDGTPTETVIKNFQARYPNVQVQVDPTPQDYETKMRALVAAGTPDDVHRINDDYVRSYAVSRLLTDLGPYLKRDKVRREDFFEFIYDFPIWEGKYWAWSTGNQPRALYINRTLFQNNGLQPPLFDRWDPPGWTWDDMILAAQKITKDFDGPKPIFGVDLLSDTGIEQTILIDSGIEDGIYSKDGKQFLMATPKGAEAMQAVIDLTCRLKVQRPYSYREGGSGVGSSTLFQQGRLGMWFTTMSTLLTLRRNIRDFDWDIAPLPKRQARKQEGSLIVYCIPKDAQHPDAGWQLLNYMTSDDGGRVFGETLFYIPVRKSTASTSVHLPQGEKPEHVKLFVDAMNYHQSINFTNNTERARQIYRPELEKAYNCDESAKTALDSIKKAVEDALAGVY